MNLPESEEVDVGTFARLFDNTTTSYKYLLFNGILSAIKNNKDSALLVDDLAMQSLAYAWYAIDYYHINFGKSDQISKYIGDIQEKIGKDKVVSTMLEEEKICSLKIISSENKEVGDVITEALRNFRRFVPYRLIAPWFENKLIGKNDANKNRIIKDSSNSPSMKCLYSLKDEGDRLKIIIKEEWATYLQKNIAIVEGWFKYKFLLYLQAKNPKILALSTKLEPPNARHMEEVKEVFRLYFAESQALQCFYSKVELKINDISHDHFLPWSFLADDPLYNFVPASREVNSSKGNKLPDKRYLEGIAKFQFLIFSFLCKKQPKYCCRYLEDLEVESGFPEEAFVASYKKYFEPLFLQAENQGFETGWAHFSHRATA